MHKLAQENTEKVLDVLTARVMFERTSVKLYDGIIDKIQRGAHPRYLRMLDTLRRHRDEEKEHEEWLEARIRGLGGDPHVKTTLAQLEEEESQGIQRIILDGHTEVSHLMHALLSAELADNAGWDLLVKLADDVGDKDAKRDFMKRLAEEMKHLAYVREAVKRGAESEVLGLGTQMPQSVASVVAGAWKKPLAAGAIVAGVLGLGAAIWAVATGKLLANVFRKEPVRQNLWSRIKAGGIERLRAEEC